MTRLKILLLLLAFSAGSTLTAQDSSPDPQMDQSTPGMAHHHEHSPANLIEEILHHGASGTTVEPDSSPHDMLMAAKGNWQLMLHGVAFLSTIQQSGPPGSDKVFSTNWLMGMAQRQFGPGQLTLRAMISLEPATVTHRFYPELFQQGETAFGNPITNGQHPHDFFMELAALYDVKVGKHSLLSFYAAPAGDPAMGPSAYAHRSSASENPIATLGHHLQDSTHIAADVITAGLTYKAVRVEGSGFHGREPDEFRWDIDSGKIDSWSTRLTVQPGKNWSAQYSFAHLTSPEAVHPGEDLQRMTASIMYNRPLARGNWASTLLWGRNHSLASGEDFNGYLMESTLRFVQHNYVWGRIENVDRTTELLLNGGPEPPGFEESFLARVQAYTVGYDREFDRIPYLSTAVGGQVTFYSKPDALTPVYGAHPTGAVLFLRVRPVSKH
ncbi:MAG TPA: hypothetical protein VI685_02330 [Candidatus Angelobacter sp.]